MRKTTRGLGRGQRCRVTQSTCARRAAPATVQKVHLRTEWGAEWLFYRLRSLALFDLLELVGRLALLWGIFSWVLEADQRAKQAEEVIKARHYRAWELINAARGPTGDGGRRDALQDLNKDGVSLAGAPLEQAYLPQIDLQGADLRVAILQGATLEAANLQGAILWGAILQGARLQSAQLQGANLQHANLWVATLSGADLRADLRSAFLQGANLQGADLRKANLQGADLLFAQLPCTPAPIGCCGACAH